MHVISTDFNSEALKNKKHWNSFTSEFFIDANTFLTMLEERGEVKVISTLINTPLPLGHFLVAHNSLLVCYFFFVI